MKVINIIGHSCSGKTTFISKLVGELKALGPVATIKHLGHHNFALEKGKDTTVFYESGVDISAGIDSEKTVVSIRHHDLVSLLDLLAGQHIEFIVIEGFKTIGLPAVVIGDLESDKVLFRNPGLDEIMNGLDQFPDYSTLHSIGAGLRKYRNPLIDFDIPGNSKPDQAPREFMVTVAIPAHFTTMQFSSGFAVFRKITAEVSSELSREYHPALVSVGLRNCWNFSTRCEFLIAILAEDVETASLVLSAVHERIQRKTTSGCC